MNATPAKRIWRWLAVPLAVLLLAAGAFTVIGVANLFPDLGLFSSNAKSSNTQVLKSVVREEQVVLVSLGIQGVSSKQENNTFLGFKVPGSERATFIQYSFNAKVGIEGRDVKVEPLGDSAVVVTMPEFIFIGHNNIDLQLVTENQGALSFATPKIDSVQMVNEILNDDSQEQYIIDNVDILEEQAASFYTSIIHSIDPDIAIRFEFPTTLK